MHDVVLCSPAVQVVAAIITYGNIASHIGWSSNAKMKMTH
jgi:hypothetical protein